MRTFNRLGYSDDENGYSGAFSWWRNVNRRWCVTCFEPSFFIDCAVSYAVTDDYGNLVRVPS